MISISTSCQAVLAWQEPSTFLCLSGGLYCFKKEESKSNLTESS